VRGRPDDRPTHQPQREKKSQETKCMLLHDKPCTLNSYKLIKNRMPGCRDAVPACLGCWVLLVHTRRNPLPLLKAQDTTKTWKQHRVRVMQAETHFRMNCVGLLNSGTKWEDG
jgi:hypothetical protein